MALVANSVIYPQGPIFNAGLVLTDGTVTSLYVAGTDGARVDAFSLTTSDTADGTLTVYIYDETAALKYQEVIPVDDLSGNGTTYTTQKPATDVLQLLKCSALDGSGIRHLYLEPSWEIRVKYLTLSSESAWVFAQGWEY